MEIAANLGSAGASVPPLARALAERLSRSLNSAPEEALGMVAAPGRIG
jgi:hypothetical protein